MSVVIVTPDNYQTIRKTLEHLHRQTIRELLEIVIVAPSTEELNLDESLMSVFAGHLVVELDRIESIGRANAAGIRRATAELVALAEDHCFPNPDWARNLIETHRGPWAVGGPAIRNANPSNSVSWADLFVAYGPWLAPTKPREVQFLPGHNSSYKRAVLVPYERTLETRMEAETLLHWELCAKGQRLYLEPAAWVDHTNFSLWSSWLVDQFYGGRVFASFRALQMSALRRLVYIIGSPLIPLVRLIRIATAVWRYSDQWMGRLLSCLPTLVIGLALNGIGQMMGYALGVGNALERYSQYEFHRDRHVTETDRRTVFAD